MPNNLSAPLADNETVTGSPYNILRQDVLNNHAHSGPNDGGRIAHGSLLDSGVYSHAIIDDKLNNLEGRIPWSRVQAGSTLVASLTWVGPGRVRLTFPQAFTNTPVVTLNAVYIGGTNIERMFIHTVLMNPTHEYVDVLLLHPGWDEDGKRSPMAFPFGETNWATTNDVYLNWMAMGF